MPKWLKWLLWCLGALIVLIVLSWFAFVFYVKTHKQEVLSYVNEAVSDKIDGELSIGDMEPTFRTFPDISIGLSNISLRDSQYHIHKHSLLDVEHVYAKVHLWSLLRKRINLLKLTITNGQVYIYVDSTGYSNAYLLKGKDDEKKKKDKKKGGLKFSCHSYAFENVRFVMDERKKEKLFNILARKADGSAEKKDGVWISNIALDAVFNSFAFNKDKGSFLKDAHIISNLTVAFDPADKKLVLDKQLLNIDEQPIELSAVFVFNQPPSYSLHIHSEEVPFQKVISWLSASISKKLEQIHFDKPMPIDGYVKGNIIYRDTPEVLVQWHTENNRLTTPFVTLDNASFTGYFHNVVKPGAGHGDDNSAIVLHDASAKWNTIPFSADSVRVDNIKYPLLHTSFHSSFALSRLNNVDDISLPLYFNAGNASINFYYKGGVKSSDTLEPYVDGSVVINGGDMSYSARAMRFRDVNATLRLKGDDLLVPNLSVTTGHTTLAMEGTAAHLFRFYFADPGKVYIDWKVKSKRLDLKDFTSFTGNRQQQQGQQADSSKGIARMLDQLNNVLQQSTVGIEAAIDRLEYNRFIATAITGNVQLQERGVVVDKVTMKHAGGKVKLSGRVNPSADSRPFHIKGDVAGLEVDSFFRAFSNFGQTTIADSNVEGVFNARLALDGQLDDSGRLVPHSLDGYVDFSLDSGRLMNVNPMKTIADIVFHNRDFSGIRLQKVSNRFNINKQKILIPPMDIISSVLYLHIQGVYSLTKGTDIAIAIPLRNPEKDGVDTTVIKEIPDKHGITVHLRAHDDEDEEGKVKISWDPFKKGKKATDSLNYNQ